MTTIHDVAGGGKWFLATTWEGQQVPTKNDHVVLDSSGASVSLAGGEGFANSLTISNDNVLFIRQTSDSVNDGLSVINRVTIQESGQIHLTSGFLHSAGVTNRGDLENDRGSVYDAGSFSNFGTVSGGRNSQFEVIGELSNAGHGRGNIETAGSFHVVGSATNFGMIKALDGGEVVFDQLVKNSGTIQADAHSLINFNGGISNSNSLVDNGGTVVVLGLAIQGNNTATALIEGADSVLKFLDGGNANVTFGKGNHDQLVLDNSDKYNGSIAGFAKSDTIDVLDIHLNAQSRDFYDPATHQLTLSDGIHNIQINIVGSYTASNFAFQSDGHGGTLVEYA